MIKIKIIAVLILLLTYCKSQEIESTVKEFLQLSQKTNDFNLYRKILVHGKEAIPVLIKKIDTNRKTYSGYFKPENSNLMSLVNYDGVYAAYMIEFILNGRKLDTTNQNPITFVLFNRDVIFRPMDMRPLELSDMQAIRKLYERWWELNKQRSIQELSIQWKKRNRPLSNSIYEWY